ETDGSYTYTLNSHDPDFIALHGGGNGTEVFTYTLKDADGDTSTATLTLQIHNNDNGVTIECLDVKGGELTVYEKNLPDGSHPDNGALTQKGVFTVHAEDGLASLKVGGIDVVLNGHAAGFPQSINTALGTLTITGYNAANGEVSYQYTLNHPDNHPNGITEHFSVVATDSDGDHANGSLDVNIVDDAPKAHNDANPYQATETNPVLQGNLLINDTQGADRIPTGPTGTTGPIVGGTFEGKYGTLVLETDGSYTYTVNPHDPDFLALHGGGNGTEVFTYTLKDADGDTSKATLTLQIHNNDDCVTIDCLDVKGGELTVYERNLPNGSHPDGGALTQSGVFTVHADDGLASLKVGSIDVVFNGHAQGFPQSMTTALGTLTITGYNAATGEVHYSYTLNHPDGHPDGITEHFNVVATDTDGSHAAGTIDVNVVDDRPQAHNDANPYQATEHNPVLMGNVLENDTQGADRIPTGPTGTTGPIVGGTFEGKYGTLVLETDGSYTYTVNPHDPDFIALHGGGNGNEVFTYTLKDADGDTSKATLTLQIHNDHNGVTVSCPVVTPCDPNPSEHPNPSGHPVAVADHVITNILAPVITVPSGLLVANDSDPHGDKLTATPTTFNTGWAAKGADFSAAALKTIAFAGHSNIDSNQLKALDRSDFFSNSALTALVVLNGYLGATNASAANAQDLYSVTLHKGETVTLDNNKGDGHLTMQWQDTNGVFHNIADGSSFTATQDGLYHIHVSNIPDTGTHSQAAESYQLNMAVNYAGAQDVTPDYHGSYTATDGHGGSSTAHVDISYQGGNTIQGTNGDDVLIGGNGNLHLHGGDGNDVLQAGTGNNELFGDNGNDLIYSGPGNDTIDGGAGNNTVSYEHATAGVHVDLSVITAQNTLGAGTDTLTNIDNVIGSHFNDTLTGGFDNNILSGGLGNDILNGAGGDDILIGGPGNNTLTGGPGNDTFKWEQGNTGHDLVTDFTLGSDKLDLSQLLQGENSSSASLDDYLHFKVTGTGANVVTTIDVSSTAGCAPTQTIDLAGVDLASHYGVSPGAGGVVAGGHDTASIINGMISDHSLKVDTV
ncbi:MAG: type secretion target, partial [Pseudomonas sp.]|nr:type secretion target [Pseudomonas sp.]